MGHNLDQWNVRVLRWLKDANLRDVSAPTIVDVGIEPALATFAADRPLYLVDEVTGDGTNVIPATPAWTDGGIVSVEYPIGDTPPTYLEAVDYRLDRSVADVDVDVLILDRTTIALGAKARIRYYAAYPAPTDDATVDRVPAAAFPAVTALAASYLCRGPLMQEAARDRAAAIPTDYLGGRDRTTQLLTAGNALEDIYRRYVGLPATGAASAGQGGAEGGPRPAHGRIDTNLYSYSLFHGGRT